MGEKVPSDTSRPPPSRSRGGVRGRGKPFPEGEEGGSKRKFSKPPTPRGLVGFLSFCLSLSPALSLVLVVVIVVAVFILVVAAVDMKDTWTII